jgi:hypothetical protein
MNNFLTKKVEKTAEKYEKKGKKVIKKLKVYAIALGVGLFVIGTFLAFMNVSKWYDDNRVSFQYPIIIKLQAPVIIEKRAKEVKKLTVVPVEAKKIVEQYPTGYEEAYQKVWLMESGKGTNKGGLNGYCLAKGEINEIGFDPQDKYCFANREEQKSTFITWLTNRMNGAKMPHCENIEQCLRVYSNNSYGIN